MDILTGDHGIPGAYELQDFLWSMTDEPHSSRRKALIVEHPELKDLMGHEWRTKYVVVALMAVQLSLAYYLREEALWGGTLKFYLIAYFVGATITQALFLAIHEISHNLAFKKFTHNKLFGLFANIPMVLPFFVAFKHYHNEHHKYQGIEGIDTDLPTKLEARLLSSTVGKLFFIFNQTWFYAFRPMFVRQQAATRWHIANWVIQITFLSLTYHFIGAGPILYLLMSAHFAGSWHPIASHFIAEHYVVKGHLETASYYGILNYLTFNVGYHQEHHDFPTVSWSSLPKLQKLGGYERLPHHLSWTMVLIEFLFNPSISLFNRVKRRDDTNVLNEKGAAKGDADYTGAWLQGTGLSQAAEEKAAAGKKNE